MIWKDIPGIEGFQASDTGQIRNKITGLIRKQRINKEGYMMLTIRDYAYSIHSMVARTFCEKPEGVEDLTVNHKDMNKLNNAADNLEWISRVENLNHARKQWGYKESPAEIHCFKDGKLFKIYTRFNQLEEDGFRRTNVSDIIHGRAKTHKGFSFVGK